MCQGGRHTINNWLENEPKETLICTIISAIALLLSITGALKDVLPFDIAWVAIILSGTPIIAGAFRGVVFEHDIKADLLVSLALIASIIVKEYFAAGEVALIMQIGSLLEDYTSGKAGESIQKLIDLSPRTARVLINGEERIIPVEEVKTGDLIRVIAGETIPVDGTIVEGTTSINQAVITGESIPVDKQEGDQVISGSLNQFGVFTMRADSVSENSSLQRMIRLTKEAEENKAPIVTAADRWATWLVVIALACAILTWIITGEFIRAVTVLVVFCPCAFILATPTAVLAGIGNAAKHGIIIRSGEALERLSGIKRIAFDKTGTLTIGKPQVTKVTALTDSCTDHDVLRLAALAEQHSEHPLGKAITESWKKDGGTLEDVTDFQMRAAGGVSAVIDGKPVLVGKEEYLKEEGITDSFPHVQAEAEAVKGATVIYVAANRRLVGFVSLRDTLRTEASETISALKKSGIKPILLTGDNKQAAETIANEVGIEEYHAEMLPEGKMDIIKQYAGSKEPICMIGDGVNDALALAGADAGIAMGGIGSDIAIESADAILVRDDIKRLPYLFDLTQKVMDKIKVNIIASLIINLTAVVLSAAGVLTPVTGALWHNCGSVFVIVNAALLLREKDSE